MMCQDRRKNEKEHGAVRGIGSCFTVECDNMTNVEHLICNECSDKFLVCKVCGEKHSRIRLRPINNEPIRVYYVAKSELEKINRLSIHETYEDVGEWVCRNFNKIRILEIIN